MTAVSQTDTDDSTRGAPRPVAQRPVLLVVLILFQMLCTAFFVYDVIMDFREGEGTVLHLMPEVAATLGLVVGLVFEGRTLMALLRRQAHMEKSLGVAAGALAELMEEYFRQWGLTPSEADVAAFTIKGYSIAEIAAMRGSAEGTVKTHLNAIYRKSGMQGRGQLVSVLIEDLLNGPLVPRRDGA
ncbi:MAG: LuxR family transcriptional regulator [Rhodobacter sp. CACIA14H1]|nr:MAG: LuxR family transcriptional regulator [Rhodobacter sp. CACIA14H1]